MTEYEKINKLVNEISRTPSTPPDWLIVGHVGLKFLQKQHFPSLYSLGFWKLEWTIIRLRLWGFAYKFVKPRNWVKVGRFGKYDVKVKK